MWTRGIEPRPRVFQTRALPLEPGPPDFHSSAASGNRTHDLSVDNRTLCLSELWRRLLSLVIGPSVAVTEGEGFEPSSQLLSGIRVSTAAPSTARPTLLVLLP